MKEKQQLKAAFPLVGWQRISPHEDQAAVRRLIARDWDRPGQNVEQRNLLFMHVRDERGHLTHVLIGLSGSPWRGLALVPMSDNALAVRVGFAAEVYTEAETSALRALARRAIADCEVQT